MRINVLALVALVLAGCVHEADYGQIKRSPTGLLLEQLTVIREGAYQKDNFSRCVVVNATGYGGMRKDKDKSIIRYDNNRTLQLTGNTRWRFAFVDRFMRFQLTAQHYNTRFYTFEKITSGERGAEFWPVAARGLEGKAALQTLVEVVETIEQCQRDLDAQ